METANKIIIKISEEFSKTPGARYLDEGEFWGEDFRERILTPKLKEAIASGKGLLIDLDGTAGYGTSFLEEAFGGLIRKDGFLFQQLNKILSFKSNEEKYLIEDIWGYMKDASNAK